MSYTITSKRLQQAEPRAWTKRVFNPRRLACAGSSAQASLAIQGLLEISAEPSRLLPFLLEWGVVEVGAILMCDPNSRRAVEIDSQRIAETLPALNVHQGVVDYVLDHSMAISTSRVDSEGEWHVACAPLVGSDQSRPQGCLYVERLPGSAPFSAVDLDMLLVLARGHSTAQTLRQASRMRRKQPSRRMRKSAQAGKAAERGPAPLRATAPRMAAHQGAPKRRPSKRGINCADTHTTFAVEQPSPTKRNPKSTKRVPLTMGLLFEPGSFDLPDFE